VQEGKEQMMTAPAVSQLVYLLDEAFQGTAWHSVLANLHSVTLEDWLWVPSGGQRSIRDIVRHIGRVKYMAHNRAFGDAQLSWDDPLVEGHEALSTIAEATVWLREGHARLRESIAVLDDAELLRPRLTNYDELKETRWIITVTMIQHDLYHAGEINHLRALHQQNDHWD
jgi:hypothetical protein